MSRAPVLTEKADETCGPNKKVTHHSHLEEAVTVNRKEKTEGGGKHRGSSAENSQSSSSGSFLERVHDTFRDHVCVQEPGSHGGLRDGDWGQIKNVYESTD